MINIYFRMPGSAEWRRVRGDSQTSVNAVVAALQSVGYEVEVENARQIGRHPENAKWYL